MAAGLDVHLALIKAHAKARADLLALTSARISGEVRPFTGWYDHAKITELAARLADITRAGQKQTAASTEVFAVRHLSALTGKRPTASGPVPVANLRGVPLEAVYGRLADQYRYLSATRGPDAPEALLERVGGPPLPRLSEEDIMDRVAEQAEAQTDDNLTLAFRAQWDSALKRTATNVNGYRRVIHPELTATGSEAPGPVCGLCVVASDRVYRKGVLLEVHTRCRCSVSAIIGPWHGVGDPGSAINKADLKTIYAAVGGTLTRAKLKKLKVTAVDNPETGPRLVNAAHTQRPTEGAPEGKRPAGVNAAVVLAEARRSVAGLEARAAAGENVAAPLAYQRALVARMAAKLR